MTAKKIKTPALFEALIMPEDIDTLPVPESPYYVIGKAKRYLHKRLHFGRVLIPVTDTPEMNDLPPTWGGFLWQEVPPIPAVLLGKAWSFFRMAWNRHKSEAMLDIYYHPDHGYTLFAPPQTASMGGVKCVRNPEHIKAGYRHVGTIHSHCNFGAYHSGTDTHDAEGHDGVHITIGNVDKNPPQYATMLVANNVKWDINLTEILEGEIELTDHPPFWDGYVQHPLAIQAFPAGPAAHNVNKGGNSWRSEDRRVAYQQPSTPRTPYTPPKTSEPISLTVIPGSTTDLLELAERIDGWKIPNRKVDFVDATMIDAELNSLLDWLEDDFGVKTQIFFRYAPNTIHQTQNTKKKKKNQHPNKNQPHPEQLLLGRGYAD